MTEVTFSSAFLVLKCQQLMAILIGEREGLSYSNPIDSHLNRSSTLFLKLAVSAGIYLIARFIARAF